MKSYFRNVNVVVPVLRHEVFRENKGDNSFTLEITFTRMEGGP